MTFRYISFLPLLFLFTGIVPGGEDTVRIDSIPVFNWCGVSQLIKADSAASSGELMTTDDKDLWHDTTYWHGNHTWCRVGKTIQHPGEGTLSVRKFNVPEDGEISVSGRAYKYHVVKSSDGVSLAVRHNSNIIWKADIDGGDTKGASHELKLTVKKGDTISFIVGQRKQIYCDATAWDPKITYPQSGKSYLASDFFNTKKDGNKKNALWCYEEEIPSNARRLLGISDPTDFGRMIQGEWLWEDRDTLGWYHSGASATLPTNEAFLAATKKQLEKTAALFEHLKDELSDKDRAYAEKELAQLTTELKTAANTTSPTKSSSAEILYAKVRGLKRRIAFSNPVADFGKMLFCKRVPTSYSHLVMQYFGWRARPGGGIFVLDEPGKSLQCRDLLGGKLQQGNVLEPRLSWDARKIVFSWVDLAEKKEYDPYKVHFSDKDDGFYHVYTVNADGSDLQQLTKGSYDDITPDWLADGDIIFSSTRRQGYARCFWWGFGKRWHVYTVHRMKPDGSNIKTLSWHDTNEWFPVVSNNGSIIYSRWDYIDRDAVTHQNLWAMRPDGTNPVAVWGNASPAPHCTFQAKPIPNTQKYIFTASAHHSLTAGSLVILDPSAGVDGEQSLKRITPEVAFPEAETRGINEFYESPWPLSEEFFLTSYSPYPLHWEGQKPNRADGLGIYLYDIFGNRELVYRDPTIGVTNAMPLAERPVPPVLASQLPTGNVPDEGEMLITDIYQGLGNKIKRGDIKEVRIVQIFPKTTRDADDPAVGLAGEENARAILGHVPVEDDGSVFFKVPARTPILLQAITKEGQAWQTMRSLTYLQPGERVSCTGCHEARESSAYSVNEGMPVTGNVELPKAVVRGPSKIDPGNLGGRPFSYVEVVQPIWDRHCIECHNDKRTDGKVNLTGAIDRQFTKSYYSLCRSKKEFWGDDGKDPKRLEKALVPRYGGRNTIQVSEPGGKYGSIGSRLMSLLQKGHEGVKLSPDEMRKVSIWIDLNAIFYGVNDPEDQERMRRGELVAMPKIQ